MKVMESIQYIKKKYFFYFNDIPYFDDCTEDIIRFKSKLGLFKIVSNFDLDTISFTRLKTNFDTEIQLQDLHIFEDDEI